MDQLAKLSAEMSTLPQKLMKNSKTMKIIQTSPDDMDQIMTINPTAGLQSKQQLSPGDSGIDAGVDLSKTFTLFVPDVYTFNGYSIPKNTLYLIIVLILVGIAIWYITSNTKKKKEKLIIDENDCVANKEEKNKDKEKDE